MDRAVREWLSGLDNEHRNVPDVKDFVRKISRSYVVYGSMVLLPSSAFTQQQQQDRPSQQSLRKLYELISHHLKTTHIAITHPIPLHTTGSISSATSADSSLENVLRSPANFEPLHGDFGPPASAQPPSTADCAAAYWVTAKQNGIAQTWAPRWTMFSRGNISEKARLLTLESVVMAVEQGNAERDRRGCCAVDLYVGIGYFAFSYLKAGVKVVLGWDLNAWSLEGLRRGAEGNRWKTVLVRNGREMDGVALEQEETRLIAFHESNECALRTIRALRQALPPVRHVNCGLLPTSRGSWETAVGVLDPDLGGWIHLHENFALAEIEAKADEVRQAFQNMLHAAWRDGTVQLEAVNRLKSYAPGVIHCVVDIYIPPLSLSSLTAT